MTMHVMSLHRPNGERETPLRWRRQHGEPRCLSEQICQWIGQHALMLYIALIATLALLVQIFDVHIVPGQIPHL